MGSAVLISKPYSDNIITIDFSPVHSTGKNYDVFRHEGFNSAVEPIRNPDDITKALEYFYSKGEYRNWCIFQIGITSGLRASDLLRLKVSDVANPVCGGGYQVKHGVKFRLECKKTKRFHKHVTVQITPAAEKTLQIYLDLMGKPGCKYENYFKNNGYLFPSRKRSNSNSKRSKVAYKQPSDPIDVDTLQKLLKKELQGDLKLPYNIGTHTLRKTFCYQFYRQNQESPMALATLQGILNHSSQSTTLAYIGITQQETDEMLSTFDLGTDFVENLPE